MPRYALTLLTLGILAIIAGCGPDVRDDIIALGDRETEYAALAENYNGNIERVDQFRAHGRIAVRWTDRDGRTHTEAGDGLILFRSPHELALTVDKMGHDVIWAGADAQQYWFFELHEDNVLMRGHNHNIGRPCSAQLPFSINPHRVPHLLGLIPLDIPANTDFHPQVEQDDDGYYLVTLHNEPIELRVHPETFLPVRVSILNARGEPEIVSDLSQPETVRLDEQPRADWPQLHSRAEINVVADDAWMTIRMGHLSDGRRGNRIRDVSFDLDALIRAHNPSEIIVLDQDCD